MNPKVEAPPIPGESEVLGACGLPALLLRSARRWWRQPGDRLTDGRLVFTRRLSVNNLHRGSAGYQLLKGKPPHTDRERHDRA